MIFEQHISNEELVKLYGKDAIGFYAGDDKKLQHLYGKKIKLVEVEKRIQVEERVNIVVKFKGAHVRFWKGVEMVLVDSKNHIVLDGWEYAELPKPTEPTMSRAELAQAGLTDAKLSELALKQLGEIWEPDRSGASVLRAKMFDRLQKVR